MTEGQKAFWILMIFSLIMWVLIMGVVKLKQLYDAGVCKVFSSDKRRRDMFNFIYESAYEHPIEWKLDVANYNETTMFSDMVRGNIRVTFIHNKLMDKSYRDDNVAREHSIFINMTLEERIRMKRAYKFLKKWNKNKKENESIDKFYIESTRFNDL